MAARVTAKPSETLQIVILTLFMTGAFFGLFTLVLVLFLLPSTEKNVADQVRDLETLLKRFRKNDEVWRLRNDFEKLRKSGMEDLNSTVRKQFQAYQPDRYPRMSEKLLSRAGKTIEYTQTVTYSAIPVQEAINLIARVKTANENIYLSSLKLRPTSASRRNTEDDYAADMVFHLYQNPDVVKELNSSRKPPAPAPAPPADS